jgi:hypothetical protein
MRAPRNANPNVAVLAGASPNQESLEQYLRAQSSGQREQHSTKAACAGTHLTKILLKDAKGFWSVVPKMPS